MRWAVITRESRVSILHRSTALGVLLVPVVLQGSSPHAMISKVWVSMFPGPARKVLGQLISISRLCLQPRETIANNTNWSLLNLPFLSVSEQMRQVRNVRSKFIYLARIAKQTVGEGKPASAEVNRLHSWVDPKS